MHSQVVLCLFPVEVGGISLSEEREREKEREKREIFEKGRFMRESDLRATKRFKVSAGEDQVMEEREQVVSMTDLQQFSDDGDGSSSSLLSGLPEELAMECLARVSSLGSLRGVSKSWQKLVYSTYFQQLRVQYGRTELSWVYTLVQSTRDGSFKWQAYDPFSSQWHDLPPVPHVMDFQLSNPGCIGLSYSVQCASTRTKLVMIAAMKLRESHGSPSPCKPRGVVMLEPALERPLIFDPAQRLWKRGSCFRVPRKWCVCGVADEKIYVASGSGKDWDRDVSKSAEVYDHEKDVWQRLNNLSSSKFSGEAMSAVTQGGKLYIASGRGVFQREGAVYTPSTGLWTKMEPGLRKGWTGSCVSIKGKFYVVDDTAGKLKVYAPEREEWTVFMEDSRLKNLESIVSTGDGKLCGIVCTPPSEDGSKPGCSKGNLIRVVDVEAQPAPLIFDIQVPDDGQAVALQVLSMMNSDLQT